MVESDLIRQCLLGAVALVFLLLALRAALQPDAIAREVGLTPNGANGYSELHAIYLGLWAMHGVLGVYALLHVEQAILGDTLALLLLGQPLGRLWALPRYGWPQGPLRVFFALEIVGALALLAVRPG